VGTTGFSGEETIYPNTDSYRDGVVKPSGIRITSISDPEGEKYFALIIKHAYCYANIVHAHLVLR
jgi:hypothetical protein